MELELITRVSDAVKIYKNSKGEYLLIVWDIIIVRDLSYNEVLERAAFE